MNNKKFRGFLAEKDITIKEAAELSGLNYNTVQRVAATGQCNLSTARALIIGLKIPLQLANDIFFGDDVAK